MQNQNQEHLFLIDFLELYDIEQGASKQYNALVMSVDHSLESRKEFIPFLLTIYLNLPYSMERECCNHTPQGKRIFTSFR